MPNDLEQMIVSNLNRRSGPVPAGIKHNYQVRTFTEVSIIIYHHYEASEVRIA